MPGPAGTVQTMIALLHGTATAPDVVSVAGVGYEVATAAPLTPGQEVTLWVHTAVAETDLSLYGFTSRAERDLFRALIKVRGVGARKALGLHALGAPVLARALLARDAAAIGKASGFSAKSGATICADLKVDPAILTELAGEDPTPGGASTVGWRSLVPALTRFGFPEAAAIAALEQAALLTDDEGELISAALATLHRGAA